MPKLWMMLLCSAWLWAGVQWDREQSVSLKRNEVYRASLILGENEVKAFAMHWTLFVDGGLVFLAKYDGFSHHGILRKRHQNNAMRISLGREDRLGRAPAYLVVLFQDFDSQKQSATFKILISGDVFLQEGEKQVVEER